MNRISQFVALDFETTGLDKNQDRIVEVALCRYKDGVLESTWTSLLNPEMPVRDFIAKLTGVPVDELAQSPLFADRAQEILDFIGDLPLVAHNAPMDLAFLNQELERIGHEPMSNLVFDTLALSRMVWWHTKNHRLENLAEELGLNIESAHRALPDALRCGELFLKAQDNLASMPLSVLQGLASLAQMTPWEILFSDIEPGAPLFSAQESSSVRDVQDIANPSFDQVFSENSPIKDYLPNFEPRKGQLHLAKATYNAFRDESLLLAEAETGSGKTLAYLSAAFSWLRTRKGRIVVATATKTLQDQLNQQEIPRLQALHGDQIRVAVLKGKDNYLCPVRLQKLLQNPLTTLSADERIQLMALVPWAAVTQSGEISEHSGFSASRQAFLWRRVSGDPKACQPSTCKCLCFAEKAKREAEQAQLVLVNHALLLRDVAMDFSLLPSYDRLIVDEAHRLEEAARHQFSRQIWFYRLRVLIQQLQHPFQADIGHLSHALAHLASEEDRVVLAECKQEIVELEKHLHRLFLKVGKQLRKKPKTSDKMRYQQGMAIEFNVSPEPFLSALRSTVQILEKAMVHLQDQRYDSLRAELFAHVQSLREFETDALALFGPEREGQVQWIEEWANPHTLKLISAPLEPGQILASKWGSWLKSAIFVSATLALKGKFDYFEKRLCLDQWKKHKIQHFLHATPFDLEAQRKILLFRGSEQPNEQGFNASIAQVLADLAPVQDASLLALFTSISGLNEAHTQLTSALHQSERLVLAQHIDGNIDNLMEQFRRRKGAVLLGTQVLWEGVDFPGDQLEVLAIAKLPFPNPNDPIVAARNEKMKEDGLNAFRDYLVPEAQMQLRQGLGRLIRTPKDKGVVILFDPRLIASNYAKSFTGLWHHKHQIVENAEQIADALKTL